MLAWSGALCGFRLSRLSKRINLNNVILFLSARFLHSDLMVILTVEVAIYSIVCAISGGYGVLCVDKNMIMMLMMTIRIMVCSDHDYEAESKRKIYRQR